MIRTGNKIVVEAASELPDLRNARVAYADAETTSGRHDKMSIDPWHHCSPCGWAVTVDGAEEAWYAPVDKLGPDKVREWISDVLGTAQVWINHNVKYDAHVALNDGVPKLPPKLVDTVVLAKMVNSDRFTHALKPLCRDWLGMPMSDELEVKAYLDGYQWHDGKRRRNKSKDYGVVPYDVLGRYACEDVLSNRQLARYCAKKAEGPIEMEIALTSELLRMEQRGLRLDVRGTEIALHRTLGELIECAEKIEDLTGVVMNDHANTYYEIFCNQMGLPVLGWTEAGNPSFDKEAMVLYLGHPRVRTDERAKAVVDLIKRFKTASNLRSLFLEPFLEKHIDGILHSSYNQLVRTGRMSCSNPNLQQFNDAAAQLIVPREGYKFVCYDGSQMEFRLICHYTQDQRALDAYAQDAATDYHALVAEMSGMKRKPAKTLNFAIAYGAGKKKVVSQLVSDEDAMAGVPREDPAEYEHLCNQMGERMWDRYHREFPGISRTSRRASNACKERGWIRNAYGRKRHLGWKVAHKAFNSLIQGCASDVVKDIMVPTADRARAHGGNLLANKHDELLFEVPMDWDDDAAMQNLLQNPSVEFRVPFLWDVGQGQSWSEAKP